MSRKYECHNQLTGQLEQVDTFEEALVLQQRLREEYILSRVDPLFRITVLEENSDGSWTQSLSDDQGNPLSNSDF